jgi:uroporphyrinogen-III synthase
MSDEKNLDRLNTPASESLSLALPTAEPELAVLDRAWRNDPADLAVLRYPCLKTSALGESTALDAMLNRFVAEDDFWLLLPSPAAAHAVVARMESLELQESLPAGRLVALGLASAQALTEMEFPHTPTEAERLTEGDEALPDHIPPGSDVIVPVAARAHDPLIAQLRRLGYTVHATQAYARFLAEGDHTVGVYLFEGRIDAIFFASPDHLRFFRRRLLQEGGVLSMLDHVRIYCADHWTAEVAAEYSLQVVAVIGSLDPAQIEHIIQARA